MTITIPEWLVWIGGIGIAGLIFLVVVLGLTVIGVMKGIMR